MRQTRRHFLASAAAAAGTITLLPFTRHATAQVSDVFETPGGNITIHPVNHASFVMETPVGIIYADPVGGAELYSTFPQPDLILITHQHGDHYEPETLVALGTDDTPIFTNPAVYEMLTDDLKARPSQFANGDTANYEGLPIDAIPAYNMTDGRLDFHPQGRDNGYVLSFDGFRIYISGDTEDIPEMRALTDIDLAFVCMNLPFTMTAEAAASAVAEFGPRVVYPYHYRGRDDGTQDPAEFARLVGEAAEVRLIDWYA